MEGKPDLVIGNYTDGNLVASLMAKKLGITQVPNLFLSLYLVSISIFLWLQGCVICHNVLIPYCDRKLGNYSTCFGENKV
jgi:hypothetical protein